MLHRIARPWWILLNSFLFLICLSFSSEAQKPKAKLTGFSAMPLPEKSNTENYSKTAASLNLPLLIDFSSFEDQADSIYFEDHYVFFNNHMADKPISKGVATFDGLNEFGRAYDILSTGTDTADMLTSKPINLSGAADTVLFSFFYQKGGFGELPSIDDSLSLRFFNPVSQKWNAVWKVSGTSTPSNFKQVSIPLLNDDYLNDGFKFRFISFGSLQGSFDNWHIDYLSLNENLSLKDSLFDDVALISQTSSLIKDYESVPWFHYDTLLNEATTRLSMRMNIIDDVLSGGNILFNFFRISQNGLTLKTSKLGASKNATTEGFVNRRVVYPYISPLNNNGTFNPLNYPPTSEFNIKASYHITGTNSSPGPEEINDTLYRTQVFKNYYAYDDGSAERAFAVEGNEDGFIIADFQLAVAGGDSLKGLYLYFAPASYDISQNEFSIVIYSSSNGLPDSLIYESDSIYSPQFTSHNFYLPYALDKSVFVPNKFFVGIKQQNNIPLSLGFDVFNTNRNSSFYGTLNNYYQNLEEGVLMMRPFFRYLPNDISVEENAIPELGFDVYPNPNQGIFKVEIQNFDSNDEFNFQVFNLAGQQIKSGKLGEEEINLGSIKPGIYLLQIISSNPKLKPGIKKIIITN